MAGVTRIQATPLLAGAAARGLAFVADVPLSFWGGYDPDTGTIIDQRHPLAGQSIAGQVLVIPTGRGSCSGSGVLLEAIQNGAAPAAILISRLDPIIALGCVLGDELHSRHPALLLIPDAARRLIHTGDTLTINRSGAITVTNHYPLESGEGVGG